MCYCKKTIYLGKFIDKWKNRNTNLPVKNMTQELCDWIKKKDANKMIKMQIKDLKGNTKIIKLKSQKYWIPRETSADRANSARILKQIPICKRLQVQI